MVALTNLTFGKDKCDVGMSACCINDHLRERQCQVLSLLLPRIRGHHGPPARVQLGEPEEGHRSPVQELGLEGGQSVQVHPVGESSGERPHDGRHEHRGEVAGGHAVRAECGAQQGRGELTEGE